MINICLTQISERCENIQNFGEQFKEFGHFRR